MDIVSKKDEILAQQILDLSGGMENYQSLKNCMTRVRVVFKDESKVDKEAIQKLDGVLGVNEAESYQIIVGPGRSMKVRQAMEDLSAGHVAGDASNEPEKKDGFIKALTNIFVPLIPAIIASGVITGINNLIQSNAKAMALAKGIKPEQVIASWHLTDISSVLGILGTATLGFIVIYVGINSALQFKANTILGGVIGAITITAGLDSLGLVSGQGGVFGVIFGVWILAKLEKFLHKIMPNVIEVIMVPFLSLLITGGLYLFAIMPLAGYLSDYVVIGIMFLLQHTGVFGGFVIAALSPALTATGLQHGLLPIQIELINQTGATPLSPVQIMSNAGLVGTGLGLALLNIKDKKMREIARGVIPTTFLAVGEPTLYGLVLPSGWGFITASIGAGFGGAMIRLLDVQQAAIGAAGMSALPLIAHEKYLQYLISYAVGALAGFVITYAVGLYRVKKHLGISSIQGSTVHAK